MKITCIAANGQLVPANVTAQTKPIVLLVTDDNGAPVNGASVFLQDQNKYTGADGTASFVISGGILPPSQAFESMTLNARATVDGVPFELDAHVNLTRYYVNPQAQPFVMVKLQPDSLMPGVQGKPGDLVKVKVFCSYGMQVGKNIPNVSVRCSVGDSGTVMTDANGEASIAPVFPQPGGYTFNVIVGEYDTFSWFQWLVAEPKLTVIDPIEGVVKIVGGTPPYQIINSHAVVDVRDSKGQTITQVVAVNLRAE